jgi:hypothetical protein
MDWSVALAYLMLATFTPSSLCGQILQYIYTKAYRFFFGRSRHQRYNLPRQYSLPCHILRQATWTAKPIWLIFDVSLPPLSNTVSGSSPNVANIPTSTTVSTRYLQLRNLLRMNRIYRQTIPVMSTLGPCGNLIASMSINSSPT